MPNEDVECKCLTGPGYEPDTKVLAIRRETLNASDAHIIWGVLFWSSYMPTVADFVVEESSKYITQFCRKHKTKIEDLTCGQKAMIAGTLISAIRERRFQLTTRFDKLGKGEIQ